MTKPEQLLHSYFLSSKETLAFAESCTGGLMSFRITSNAGASNYFLGSFVTYSLGWKRDFLGVSEETLSCLGAVSLPCVEEMARGLFHKTRADWVLAISGVMGPTGEKAVGTVYCAVMRKGALVGSCQIQDLLPLDRENLMQESATGAFEYLWQLIQG